MKKYFVFLAIVAVLGFTDSSTLRADDNAEPQPVVARTYDSSSGKLDEISQKQDEILKKLDELKAEIQIVKVRASDR